ncbi:MAG: MoaD/ThiS family protein [Epsilonproteobacteria bacterium]|nr:MoaD/ThiS family protein [Campylobacterota bacterium]
MATVEFLGPINREPMDVDIANLSELKEIFEGDTELEKWLENSAIAVNDALVSHLNIPLLSRDKISLLPPVCGG